MERRPASEQYVEAWVEDQLNRRVSHQLVLSSEAQDDLYAWANLNQPIARSTKQGPSYGSINSAPDQPARIATAYVPEEVSFWRLLILLPLATFAWSGTSILLDLNACAYVDIHGSGRIVGFECSPTRSIFPIGVELPGLLVGLILIVGYAAIAAWALAPVIRNYRHTHSVPAPMANRPTAPTTLRTQEPEQMIDQSQGVLSVPRSDDIEERLVYLSSLHADGVINESEYERKRHAIIDEI